MPKIRELTAEERRSVVTLALEGISFARIALRLHCSRQTAWRVWKRFEETAVVAKLPRSGRPQKTTLREDRRLFRLTKLQRFNPAKFLAASWSEYLGRNISTKTVRRRLHRANIRSRVARRKPLISLQNRVRRVRWARRVQNWTVQDNWRHIVFSDESRFCLSFDDGRIRVWRTNGTAYHPGNLTFFTRNALSIMFWGCIGYHGVGELVMVEGNLAHAQYIDILDGYLLQSVENIFGDREHPFVFQDDNAPPHRAHVVQDWMFEHGINRMDWPAQSPDANPIENLWDDIERAIVRDHPATREDLIRCVYRAWGEIAPERLHGLYETLPRRAAAIIRSHGYATKY